MARGRVTITVNQRNILRMVTVAEVARQVQKTARDIVEEAQAIARREAYDSGAYHDSIHTEPDKMVYPDGSAHAVAGGAVNPRYAPRAGTMRGPDVDYAAYVEYHNGTHPMRRAAEKVARKRGRRRRF